MKSFFFGILIIGFLFSCRNNQEKLTDQNTQTQIDSSALKIISDTMRVSIPNVYSEVDTNEFVKILKPGVYHSDEIWDDVEEGIWYSISWTEHDFLIEKIKLIASRVHDPILDEDESIKTGWQIAISEEEQLAGESTVLLVSGIKLKEEYRYDTPIPNAQLLPGDTLAFDFGIIPYKLFAAGKAVDDENSESNIVEDYKLFLTATKNGQQLTQMLVAHDNFDDAMVSILFIGDIDGDDLPDLILDTARHYNVTNPTLYLSKGAAENQLLQVVGWHRSVGC